MATLAHIDGRVQYARGKASRVVGQTYDVYRLSSKTSPTGVVSASSRIAANIRVQFEAKPSNREIEVSTGVKFLSYEGLLDVRKFTYGDVFVQRTDSYEYEGMTYVLMSRRPMPRISLFASAPKPYATLSRPESNPAHIDSGRVPTSVPVKDREWPLTLSNGYYSFQQTGTPVSVPVGYSFTRARGMPKSDTTLGELWDDTERSIWDMFVPNLKGQPLIPRDIVTGGNGDRYEIVAVQPMTAALYGQFLQIRRIRS